MTKAKDESCGRAAAVIQSYKTNFIYGALKKEAAGFWTHLIISTDIQSASNPLTPQKGLRAAQDIFEWGYWFISFTDLAFQKGQQRAILSNVATMRRLSQSALCHTVFCWLLTLSLHLWYPRPDNPAGLKYTKAQRGRHRAARFYWA